MKILKSVGLLIFVLATISASAQEFLLQGPWKISFEDNKEFSKADVDDSGWQMLNELKWSDDHKTTANRTLWVRKKVIIPSSLQAAFAKTGLLSLSMGKVLRIQSDQMRLKRRQRAEKKAHEAPVKMLIPSSTTTPIMM